MVSANLTRYARTSTGSFTESTIKGLVVPGGSSNAAGVSLPNIAKWARTLYTSDVIKEGDRVKDASAVTYDVHHVQSYYVADAFEYYMAELLLIDDYTLQTLSFGDADTYTGLYAETYADTTIYGAFSQRGQSTLQTPLGFYGKYDYVLVTADAVVESDRLTDTAGNIYKVELVTEIPSSRIDFAFCWYAVFLTKTEWATSPTTSGTWHLDADDAVTDARYRWKLFFDTDIDGDNITKDNATTNASTHIMFYHEKYPITRLLLYGGKNLDVVATLKIESSKPLLGYNSGSKQIDKIYAFEEIASITVSAVDKSGVTAENVIDKFCREILHTITDNSSLASATTGSNFVRSVEDENMTYTAVGESVLVSKTIRLYYKRRNLEYAYSGLSFTYGASREYTYYFPNVVRITYPKIELNDALLDIPGRVGTYTQVLGMASLEVEVTCDLDVDSVSYTWKRPQATTPKTDRDNFLSFLDVIHNNGNSTSTYQNLALGWGTFPVRLVKVSPSLSGDNTVTLTFREYNASNASGTYTSRWGIS